MTNLLSAHSFLNLEIRVSSLQYVGLPRAPNTLLIKVYITWLKFVLRSLVSFKGVSGIWVISGLSFLRIPQAWIVACQDSLKLL